MSTGYLLVSLKDLLENDSVGEEVVNNILSNFSCPQNEDLESFLKYKAIEFQKFGFSSTYLVMAQYKGEYVLCSYFTLAIKVICVDRKTLTKGMAKRIGKFARFDDETQKYTLPSPLIAQLGKNYQSGYDKLITGDELLKFAIEKVQQSQAIVGGKIVYLECEDIEGVKSFYLSNGFVDFGKRELDKEESSKIKGKYLVQMLKYLH